MPSSDSSSSGSSSSGSSSSSDDEPVRTGRTKPKKTTSKKKKMKGGMPSGGMLEAYLNFRDRNTATTASGSADAPTDSTRIQLPSTSSGVQEQPSTARQRAESVNAAGVSTRIGTSNQSIVVSPTNPDKLIITLPGSLADGGTRQMEVDRWCPHKQVDLANGWLEGCKLICPKHKWEFDLEQGGMCVKKHKSLKARLLQW